MFGIICAMQIEADVIKQRLTDITETRVSGLPFMFGKLCGVDIVLSSKSYGKVQAAMTAEIMIREFKATHIINVGVGGNLSKTLSYGEIAVAEQVVQHDADSSPIGDPVGFISGINVIEFPCDKKLVELIKAGADAGGLRHAEGTIATGDQFIAKQEEKDRIHKYFANVICCDMESGAVGQACYMNNTPFAVIRAISDNADGTSPADFVKFTELVADNTTQIIEYAVKNLTI